MIKKINKTVFFNIIILSSIFFLNNFVTYGQTEDKISFVHGCCLDCENINRGSFSQIPILDEFYKSVNDSLHILPKNVDTIDFIITLLNASRNNLSVGCFLPFLRLFDEKSDSLYKITPFMSAGHPKYLVYVADPKIQYLVLFAIHHKFIANFKLPKGYYFYQIYLKKRHSEEQDYWFNQHDYDILYDIYTRYFKNLSFKKRHWHKDPLAHSDYKWVITIKHY